MKEAVEHRVLEMLSLEVFEHGEGCSFGKLDQGDRGYGTRAMYELGDEVVWNWKAARSADIPSVRTIVGGDGSFCGGGICASTLGRCDTHLDTYRRMAAAHSKRRRRLRQTAWTWTWLELSQGLC